MANRDELIGALRSLLTEQFAPKPRYIRAVLGDGRGNVVVPGNPDRSYARFTRDSTTYFEVFNRTVNPVNDWPILVGELPWQPGLTQVVDTDWSVFEQSGWGDELGNTSPHAPTHVRRDGSIGSDPLDVYLPMLAPARAYTTVAAPSTVYVNALEYGTTGTFWQGLPGIDLQPLMDATVTGTMRFAGVYINTSTNTLGVVTGSTTVHTSAFDPPRVSFPATNAIPVARVKLYGGQAVLSEINDFRDARRLFSVGGTGGTGSGWPFDTINVNPDGSADHTTIQAAINSISEFSSGVIFVSPGTYTENLAITNRDVLLVGFSGDAVSTSLAKLVVINGTITINYTGTGGSMFDMAVLLSNLRVFVTTAATTALTASNTTTGGLYPLKLYILDSYISSTQSNGAVMTGTPIVPNDGGAVDLTMRDTYLTGHSSANGLSLVDNATGYAIRCLISVSIAVDADCTYQGEYPLNSPTFTGAGTIDSIDRLAGEQVTYSAASGWAEGDVIKWNNTTNKWVVGAGAPGDAQYVTMALTAGLANERKLTEGSGIDIADGGAGGNATVSLDVNGLTEETTPASTTDFFPMYDASAGANKKVTQKNILKNTTLAYRDFISAHMLMPGLISFWPLGISNTATTLMDIASALPLTIAGNPVIKLYNGIIPYMAFDGTGDVATSTAAAIGNNLVGTEAIIDATIQGHTFGIWVRVASVAAARVVSLGTTTGNDRGLWLRLGTSTYVYGVSDNGTTTFEVTAPANPTTNQWYGLFCRYAPSTALKIWLVDPVAKTIQTATNVTSIPASIFNPTAGYAVGGQPDATSLFTGDLSCHFVCKAQVGDAVIEALAEAGMLLYA